jgi:tetratricopeptide (TPR) repeat protein
MTVASLLDDQTASAIRDAMSAARTGRLADAVSIGERALKNGGDAAALNAMLGALQCQSGHLEFGIRHLRAAQQLKPSDAVIASNLATALAQQEDYDAALEVLTDEIARTDPTMRLLRIRAFLAQHAEDYETSIPIYEAIVAAAPDDWETWNNLGNTRRLAGDAEAGLEALERAMELKSTSGPVRLNYATALIAVGRTDEAEQHLRSLADDFPDDAKPLRELHALMKGVGHEEAALEAIEEAVRRDPTDIELIMALAAHRLSMLQNEAAEAAYRRVIELQPSHELAHLGLAAVFELSNRVDDLTALVETMRQRGLSENILNFVGAMENRRRGRFAEGLAMLERVPESLESARRYHLLGQLHEGAGKYDQAFEAFTRTNELHGQDPTRPLERASAYRESLRVQIDMSTPAWVKPWRKETAKDQRPAPTFLVGFPRSGTTLLDTMLMGHPDAQVLEEEPTLLEAAKLLQPFEKLPVASDEQIGVARDEYFRVAARHASLEPGKLLVDKNPLSMNLLPIIHRLFPNARVILALRHPCDVVFSCYAANFKLNDAMPNFLGLDTAAALYDLSFKYFEKTRELFDMPVHIIRYENVVADPAAELRPLLGFLGLEWNDQVVDHEATAAKRGRIKTASYAQVAEPLYQRSAGRWQNFRKQLEPVLPVLEPWVRKFGYST